MSSPRTRADSLRFFLTGAASHEGAQADPDLSLGDYLSTTRSLGRAFLLASPIGNVRVEYVSGLNGTGNGTITALDANHLAYSAPGGELGDRVAIASGESRILEDGADPGKFVQVTRTSSSDLRGAMTVQITDVLNDVLGQGNRAVLADETYRCIGLRAEGALIKTLKIWVGTLGTQRTSDSAQLGATGSGTIGSSASGAFADWPASGFCLIKDNSGATREIVYYASRTDSVISVAAGGRGALTTPEDAGAANDLIVPVPGIRIALEVPSPIDTGNVQVAGTETSEPTVSWVAPDSASHPDVLSIATLRPGEWLGLWIARDTEKVTLATAWAENWLRWSFTAVG